jgi:hypothetical protein
MSSLARSPQLRAKCRNLQQAIFSESVHTQVVYARSTRAISRLCSLRPLPASSITPKPRRPPVGFAWLRHSAGGFLPPAFFLSRVDPHHCKTLKSPSLPGLKLPCIRHLASNPSEIFKR